MGMFTVTSILQSELNLHSQDLNSDVLFVISQLSPTVALGIVRYNNGYNSVPNLKLTDTCEVSYIE